MLGHDHRKDKHRSGADDTHHLNGAEDPRALMVFGGDHRGPGRVAEQDKRCSDIVDEEPADEIRQAHPARRYEQHVDWNHQHRGAEQQPHAVASEGRTRTVHEDADKRVEEGVRQPHGPESQPHGAQSQAEMTGVVARQVDAHGDRQGADAKARCREGDQGRELEPGMGVRFRGHAAIPGQRFPDASCGRSTVTSLRRRGGRK